MLFPQWLLFSSHSDCGFIPLGLEKGQILFNTIIQITSRSFIKNLWATLVDLILGLTIILFILTIILFILVASHDTGVTGLGSV